MKAQEAKDRGYILQADQDDNPSHAMHAPYNRSLEWLIA